MIAEPSRGKEVFGRRRAVRLAGRLAYCSLGFGAGNGMTAFTL